MNQNHQKTVEHLHMFLADTEGETSEEVRRELQAAGVDVAGFVRDIRSIVAQGQSARMKRSSRLARFANMTRQEILRLLEEMQAGLSNENVDPVLSHADLADIQNLSDEQLRDLIVKMDRSSADEPE
jgi:hypothetical protein